MKVLVRETIADAGVELLRAKFDVDVDTDSPLEEIIGDYDAIIIRSATKVTADLIAAGTKLKVIGRAGVGVDNVDVDAATRRGIVVANAPESNIVSAAEHTIGLLVALARNIPQAHAALDRTVAGSASKWGGVELAEKTLGVLGFGRIGQPGRPARPRAADEGARLRPVRLGRAVPRARRRERVVRRASSPRADFLTLHLPLNDETRGVDRRRGDRVDERRRPASSTPRAASSSTRPRSSTRSNRARSRAPRSTSSRRSRTAARCSRAPNIVVTPHLAASTDEAQDRAGVIVAEQVVGGARRRPRHERGQHPDGRRRGPRGARPVRAARREARPASRWSSRAATCARSSSSTTASSPSTTRACSPSRR